MTTQQKSNVGPALRELYPALASLDPAVLDAALARAEIVTLPAGTPLFGEGSVCNQFPLVLEGSIRVAKVGDGRELQLYPSRRARAAC